MHHLLKVYDEINLCMWPYYGTSYSMDNFDLWIKNETCLIWLVIANHELILF